MLQNVCGPSRLPHLGNSRRSPNPLVRKAKAPSKRPSIFGAFRPLGAIARGLPPTLPRGLPHKNPALMSDNSHATPLNVEADKNPARSTTIYSWLCRELYIYIVAHDLCYLKCRKFSSSCLCSYAKISWFQSQSCCSPCWTFVATKSWLKATRLQVSCDWPGMNLVVNNYCDWLIIDFTERAADCKCGKIYIYSDRSKPDNSINHLLLPFHFMWLGTWKDYWQVRWSSTSH